MGPCTTYYPALHQERVNFGVNEALTATGEESSSLAAVRGEETWDRAREIDVVLEWALTAVKSILLPVVHSRVLCSFSTIVSEFARLNYASEKAGWGFRNKAELWN